MNSPDYSHFHQYRVQESVKELKRTLSEINIPFLMYHGEAIEILDNIRSNYEILALFANEET
jgi:deoxyribodipyrimidine photolyase